MKLFGFAKKEPETVKEADPGPIVSTFVHAKITHTEYKKLASMAQSAGVDYNEYITQIMREHVRRSL